MPKLFQLDWNSFFSPDLAWGCAIALLCIVSIAFMLYMNPVPCFKEIEQAQRSLDNTDR